METIMTNANAAAPEPSRRSPLRSSVAVFAGLVLIVLTSTATDAALHAAGIFPAIGQNMSDPLLALATAYRVAYSVLGCWLAARLAPARPMAHALALGVVGIVLSTAGTIAMWDKGHHWYPLTLIAISLPTAWLGGRLHTRGRTA
jgi:hypothetical protein